MQTHYTATAKGNLLLELPIEASVLNIQPGSKIEVVLETQEKIVSVQKISVMGKYRGLASSEGFMRRKQEEIDREDRPRR